MDREFIDWAASHGVIIDKVEYNAMVRVPTTAHPNKRNGVYFYGNRSKGCCAWDIDGQWHSYRSRHTVTSAPKERLVTQKKTVAKETLLERIRFVVSNSSLGPHPYLERKGLSEFRGLVYKHGFLVVPMHAVDGSVCGAQLIDEAGSKRMMRGSTLRNARLVLGAGSRSVYVEGYATGLSVLKAARHAGVDARVIVCFCAGNLTTVARQDRAGVIIADNDKSKTGQNAAIKAKLPFWQPPRAGEDANDVLTSGRIDMLAAALKRLLNP